ncbi:transaldolase [Shewanella sp. 10N.286.51.B7]|uniref:transaldolase n=1 Tax=Shewanella sp. 10N.286.51.B7 TaxID=1880836 RepID=UPI000CAB2BDB|nr:transaldolase [Shewanella sp. 10N.286.51.B7]PMG78237.1 transaldolase [Shewanella sp. 10N.286.51.B7]
MMNMLEQLKKITTVVADSGDIDAIKLHKPIDATTNPSLILQASKLPQYQYLVIKSISQGKNNIDDICDHLTVNFGCEILKCISGRISSEIDARLSFDTVASIEKAKKIIALYAANGIDKSRVLIKLAATWQGIKAAEELEKQGIHCNLTLLFSMNQAIACAEAKVTLISPFVGRILDWHVQQSGKQFEAFEDPGVLSVKAIFDYYKTYDYQTEIMAASFRNIDEIIALAGCDLLTIAPSLLTVLNNTQGELVHKLNAKEISKVKPKALKTLSFEQFSWQLNEDEMACDKLSEGIRNFAKDQTILVEMIQQLGKAES